MRRVRTVSFYLLYILEHRFDLNLFHPLKASQSEEQRERTSTYFLFSVGRTFCSRPGITTILYFLGCADVHIKRSSKRMLGQKILHDQRVLFHVCLQCLPCISHDFTLFGASSHRVCNITLHVTVPYIQIQIR